MNVVSVLVAVMPVVVEFVDDSDGPGVGGVMVMLKLCGVEVG